MTTPSPRVLLVDDEPGMGRLVELSLLGLGASVVQVADLAGARDAARERPPDVVLLDISLEIEDGLAILPDLRREMPDVPVIAFSVHESRAREARAKGASGFIAKPFRAVELKHVVRRSLERRGG